MPKIFACPSCGRIISSEEAAEGCVSCPLCRAEIVVPEVADSYGQNFNCSSACDPCLVDYAGANTARPGAADPMGALLCGIFGVVLVPLALVGLVLGIRALSCTRHAHASHGRVMAVSGIAFSAIGLAIFPFLFIQLFTCRVCRLPRRTVCAANLRGIGQAMYIYAQDDPGLFPAIGPQRVANDGAMAIFDPAMRSSPTSIYDMPSPTVDMWTVVRQNNTTPKQFNCPMAGDVPDPAQDTTQFYDFAGPANLSYAYHYQHDPDMPAIGLQSRPDAPFMSDANPYIKGGVTASPASDRTGPGRGNSLNHKNREGQNVLYQDGHVSFDKTPAVWAALGPVIAGNRDNIYTSHRSGRPADPGEAAPTSKCANPGSSSDAVLVP